MEPVELRLRPAVASDADTATLVAHAAKAHWGYPPHWIARWTAELTITSEYLAGHHVVVAMIRELFAGFYAIEPRGDRWSLAHLWVLPEWHGHGIGRRLLADAIAAAAPGVLEVESDPYAAPFYERCGGRRVGEIPAGMPEQPTRTLPVLEFSGQS